MEGDVGCGSRVYPLAKAAVLVMPYYLASFNTAGRPGQRRSLARPCRPAQVPIGALLVDLLDVTQLAQV